MSYTLEQVSNRLPQDSRVLIINNLEHGLITHLPPNLQRLSAPNCAILASAIPASLRAIRVTQIVVDSAADLSQLEHITCYGVEFDNDNCSLKIQPVTMWIRTFAGDQLVVDDNRLEHFETNQLVDTFSGRRLTVGDLVHTSELTPRVLVNWKEIELVDCEVDEKLDPTETSITAWTYDEDQEILANAGITPIAIPNSENTDELIYTSLDTSYDPGMRLTGLP